MDPDYEKLHEKTDTTEKTPPSKTKKATGKKKPKKRKKTPADLSLLVGISSIILSIFFILDGNMAISNPSIKKSSPIAVMRSLIKR